LDLFGYLGTSLNFHKHNFWPDTIRQEQKLKAENFVTRNPATQTNQMEENK